MSNPKPHNLSPSLLLEWTQSQPTKFFFDEVKLRLLELQAEPRFRLHQVIDGKLIPITQDHVALSNAYHEGKIEALRELLLSLEEIKELKPEDEDL